MIVLLIYIFESCTIISMILKKHFIKVCMSKNWNIFCFSVAKIVAPKKEALQKAQDFLEEALVGLRIKQESLKDVQDKLAALEKGLQEAQKEKQGWMLVIYWYLNFAFILNYDFLNWVMKNLVTRMWSVQCQSGSRRFSCSTEFEKSSCKPRPRLKTWA